MIEDNPQGFHFNEFEEVIRQARASGLLVAGDSVILVAGYPQGQPGSTTLLNIYEVPREHERLEKARELMRTSRTERHVLEIGQRTALSQDMIAVKESDGKITLYEVGGD